MFQGGGEAQGSQREWAEVHVPAFPAFWGDAGDEGGDEELEGRVRPAPELLLLIQEWETTREVSTPRIQGHTGPRVAQ